MIKRVLRNLLGKLPYVRHLKMYKDGSYVPPGHFYSPLVSPNEILTRVGGVFSTPPSDIAAIDLNRNYQIELLDSALESYNDILLKTLPKQTDRYYAENKYFTEVDYIGLCLVIQKFRPNKIVEVGSGFSSAAMLDFNEIFFDNRIKLNFIEPFPENRLKKLLRVDDSFELTEQFIQDVDLDIFTSLDENDILFVDSSHVVKTGSDVNFLLFEVLPSLRSGVLIHLHDIFFPFEYPKQWIEEKRSWNESYFIRAFLMHNNAYEIVLFSSYIQKTHFAWIKEHMSRFLSAEGSSLWIRKK